MAAAPSISRSLQQLLPATRPLPPALKTHPANLFKVLARTPNVVGKEVHQIRWSDKQISDCYWRVTRGRFKCNGDHGKLWGQLYWKGKLVTKGVDERIRGSLKYKWIDGRSKAKEVSPPTSTSPHLYLSRRLQPPRQGSPLVASSPTMTTSHELIDAQFDKAVSIVQALPPAGPIQTGYEDKLLMYSLYKQATAGNVNSPRPGLWDMLGRAKWDAWAKHKDLNSYEAKWMYVGALLKVLRRYSDRTAAADLIRELEESGGDPANLVMSRSLSRDSDSSDSEDSDEDAIPVGYVEARSHLMESEGHSQILEHQERPPSAYERQSQISRPPSSVSSNRYRTPMASSMATLPPPTALSRVPETQPLPGFETPSAFADPSASSSFYPQSSPYSGPYPDSRIGLTSPPNVHPQSTQYRTTQTLPRPASRSSLEHSVENVQAHLAAISERLELLESTSGRLSQSRLSASPRASHSDQGSPRGRRNDPELDLDDLGMWSLLVSPVSRGLEVGRALTQFFARDENRTPGMAIVRRLTLDVSFLFCVLWIFRSLWRKSGVRRREVRAALIVLWRAVIGSQPPRTMVDRAV
ncbi:unnamed protein product [Mycena citricolor]|uniref:ACB domain-containing protein n=1 Tax=Mycena citricolor TaxID=2018698 RepID=A0AAD2K3S3_9AGAR|nr:unnamed protein product [Mycena citricolor]